MAVTVEEKFNLKRKIRAKREARQRKVYPSIFNNESTLLFSFFVVVTVVPPPCASHSMTHAQLLSQHY